MLLCTFETNPSNTDGQGDQTSAFCNIRCSYSQRAGCCVSHAFTSTCWGFNKCAVEASTPSFIFFYFCAERTSCAASVELVCFSRNPNACLRRATLRHAAGCEYGQGVFLAATMPRHRESDRERDTRTHRGKGLSFRVSAAHTPEVGRESRSGIQPVYATRIARRTVVGTLAGHLGRSKVARRYGSHPAHDHRSPRRWMGGCSQMNMFCKCERPLTLRFGRK